MPAGVLGDLTGFEACFADVQREGPPLPVAWHPAQSRAHVALTSASWCLYETCASMLQLHPEVHRGCECAGRPPTQWGRGLLEEASTCAMCPLPSSSDRVASPSHVSGWVPVGESAQVRGRRHGPWEAGLRGEPGLGSWSLLASGDPVILHSESLSGLWPGHSSPGVDRWRENRNKP